MAAAEARAVWQRAANRCFVQEDAKRAPKLACCQSSSSSSKPVDAEAATEAGFKPDHPTAGFKPFNRTPSYPDLPPDASRWLPMYGYQKGLTLEQLEAEVEMLRAGIQNPNSRFSKDDLQKKEITKLNTDSLSCSESKKGSEFGFDPVSPWIGNEKSDPWWRVTDRNDLASFVAQKSLDHIENCDLPPPQKRHVRRNLYSGLQGFSSDEIVASSSVQEHIQDGPAKPFRNSPIRTQIDRAETQLSEIDPSKAELLEALRHSQTRAREAEKAAQQAYAEKEDIVKLFFRQASQLFAYKQWLRMLQLETLYLQIKINEKPISSLFPVGLPWIPARGKKMGKSWQKGKRGKRNQPRHNIGNYCVALAFGLGLVGAGLLLGWTVGWLLPF